MIDTAGIYLTNDSVLNAYETRQTYKNNKVTVDNAVTKLEDGSKLVTPFWRVESDKEGPSLLLIAAQHGNEVQGAEVARRFQEICASQLVAGSVWLLPMANLPAVRSRKHSFDLGPEENNRMNPGKLHNMQRHWPGDPNGNDTARLAWALDQKVLRHCSHIVDMHCWEHIKAAETLAVIDHEPSAPLGVVTTTRFISYRVAIPPAGEKMMVAQMIQVRGGGALVMELSGQFQMQERQVEIGLSSMVNIAKLLGIIEGEPEPIEGPRVERRPDKSHEVLAPCQGMFMPAMRKDQLATLNPDDYVEEGQSLGHIIRETNLATVTVIAPVSGYLWQFGMCHRNLCDASLPAQHPYAEEGDRIAMIVTL